MSKWEKTDEPGIYRHSEIDGKFKVDVTATDPSGARKRRRKTIEKATMMEARNLRLEIQTEIRRPATVRPQRKLLADFAADWMRDRIRENRWAESTTNKNRRILAHHILPVIGNLYVDELDRRAIRRWIDYAENARRKRYGEMVPYSNATLRSWWGRLKELVNALYLAGHCDRRLIDWCRDRRGPTSDVAPRREHRTMTMAELCAYVDKAKIVAPRRYAEISTLAFTGMRAGELFGLEWRHINRSEMMIRVEQSVARSGKIKCTKTGKARTVPMVPLVADAIEAHRKRLVLEQNPGLHDGVVFPAQNGERRAAQSLHKPMRKIATACDLDIRVGPQVMRKTFVTLMGNVVNRETVKAISGHETDAMHDHYTNIRAEDRRRAVIRVFGEGLG